MLIIGGEVGRQTGLDVRVAGERVVEVGPGLGRLVGEPVIDAAGGAVIPALHDHHVHLRALAAAHGSVTVGPPTATDGATFASRLRQAARTTPPGQWLRAVGYHESVAGPLDRHALDRAVPDRPVRVQHRSGALWVLNSPALAAVGADRTDLHGIERDEGGTPTGRLWRLDAWLASVAPPAPLDLAAACRQAARRGIAGFTDADPSRTQDDVDALAAAAEHGDLPQRVVLMSVGGLDLEDGSRLQAGPRKLLLDDITLPTLGGLTAWCAAAHADGEPVAVHCVTRLQLVVTLSALAEAGAHPGDRIEHGAVVPPELRDEMRRLGVTVVTQPNFIAERGDAYLSDVDADDLPWLYPCASLLAGGIRVAAGTDAPFGHPDPWAAVRAAANRRTRAGAVIGPGERVAPDAALELFLGHPADPAAPRGVRPGAPADLCVLDRPLERLNAAIGIDDVDADGNGLDPVAVTIAAGRVIADNR